MSAHKRRFIFYNSRFFTVDGIFTKKNIFLKHDLHILFTSFFSKMDNKKLLFLAVRSLIKPEAELANKMSISYAP